MIEQSYRQPIRNFTPTTHIFSSITKEAVEREKMRDVRGIFLPYTQVDSSITEVEKGLDFILKHLSGPQFPRKISTALFGNRQKEVSYKDVAISHYEGARWLDCRISAFYVGQKNPDLVFIDLDRKDFKSDRTFKTALTKILKRIEKKIGGHPTVIWSGNGYHIIQPIDCPVNLDIIKEFAGVVRDKKVNKAFLQFGASYLSDNKKDSNNRSSLESCLLRIPGSINGKCKKEGKDPEVKILQEWDGFRPHVKLMVGSFYSYLVDKKIKDLEKQEKRAKFAATSSGEFPEKTQWIERLMKTPINDYRQIARDLIIIPYLIVRKGMTDVNEIEAVVLKWADMCNELEPLRPSYREFERDIRYRIDIAMRDMIPPMSFDKFQEENPELARKLRRL
jgi:hypothetical protein